MKTTLLRAGALSCALLATTALTAPATAQSWDLPPPARYQTDENGVDLTRGTHLLNVTDIAIGPDGPGGLAYVRQLSRFNGRNPYDMGVFDGGTSGWSATIGLRSYTFSLSGSTFTSTDGSAATLTKSGTTYTLTTEDGTVATYAYNVVATADSARKSRATSVVHPTGEQLNLAWASTTYCSNNSDGCGTGVWRVAVRLQSVSSSLGYQLHLNYGQATASDLADYGLWKRLDGVTAINTTVESCDPSAHSCSLTQTWPTVTYSGNEVTDPAGRTTRYTATESTFSIRRPSSTSDNIVYNFATDGIVTSVVRDGLTWSYDHSVAGNVATMEVTDPGNHTRTIVSDLDVGLPTSVTNEVGQTTTYAYDSSGRLTRMTAPENNYVELAYDARGNVTTRTATPKPDTGLPTIVTSAAFPSSCTNVRICNQPTSTTDARGNVTDYTYDTTHGGLLTATAPAPTAGAVRPQTRVTYSALTQPGGGSVYRTTQISQCQTTSSCTNQADEVRTTIAYSQANLQPSSATSGSGDGALAATVTLGYDHIGRPITVDGPLAGTADTARTRYNLAGQAIGTVSPDPDGAGALKHRARRVTYNGDGQVSRVESGTVNSQSDADWAAFAPLETVDVTYDSSARPIRQTLKGSDANIYAVADTSYDTAGRPECAAVRMNPAAWGTLTAACTAQTAGSHGPDRISRTTYDAANRVTELQTGYGSSDEAQEVTTVYTNNGRVSHVTDAMNNRTTYVYDGHDRLSRTRMPDPSTDNTSSTTDYEELTYETVAGGTLSSPLVASRRLRDGISIGYSHDALGRLTAIDRPDYNSTSQLDVLDSYFAYDNLGRMTAATHAATSQPGQAQWNLSFSHDALGRLLSQTDPVGTVSYQYDAAGRRTRLTYPGSGLYVEYDYLVTGEVAAIRENGATSGAGVLATFAHDDHGRRTSLTRGNGTTTSYSYDNVSRMTQLAQNLNGTASDITLDFTYNPAGQIASSTRSNDAFAWTGHYNVSRAYTANGLNQYSASGSINPAYDARGNLTSAGTLSAFYSSENALLSAWPLSLLYDPVGRLVQTGASTVSRFGYDPGSGSGAGAPRMIVEYDGSNAVARRFVFGPGADEPIVWYEGSGTSTRRWFHADERGSVIAVSDGNGDLHGNRNRYDEHGIPDGTLTGRFGFTGQMFLPEAGLYHYRARTYSPTLGRFLQTDPIGFGGGMNFYAYVRNDPVNLTDPLGLFEDIKVVASSWEDAWRRHLTFLNFIDVINSLPRFRNLINGEDPDEAGIVVTARRLVRSGGVFRSQTPQQQQENCRRNRRIAQALSTPSVRERAAEAIQANRRTGWEYGFWTAPNNNSGGTHAFGIGTSRIFNAIVAEDQYPFILSIIINNTASPNEFWHSHYPNAPLSEDDVAWAQDTGHTIVAISPNNTFYCYP